jgi:hypothetical protein
MYFFSASVNMEAAGSSRNLVPIFNAARRRLEGLSIPINIIIFTKCRSMLCYLNIPCFDKWFHVSCASCGPQVVTSRGEGSWPKLCVR